MTSQKTFNAPVAEMFGGSATKQTLNNYINDAILPEFDQFFDDVKAAQGTTVLHSDDNVVVMTSLNQITVAESTAYQVVQFASSMMPQHVGHMYILDTLQSADDVPPNHVPTLISPFKKPTR